MARVVNCAGGEWVTYVPDIDGNRSDLDPFTVEIKTARSRDFRSAVNTAVVSKSTGNRVDEKIASAQRAIFIDHVRNVRGYSINGTAIETSEQLYDLGEVAVVSDVEAAVQNMNRLSEGDLGKLRQRSGS